MTTLPDRETFLAKAILSTLRKWKQANGAPDGLWFVTDDDLDALEQYAAELWEMYEKTEAALRRSPGAGASRGV